MLPNHRRRRPATEKRNPRALREVKSNLTEVRVVLVVDKDVDVTVVMVVDKDTYYH